MAKFKLQVYRGECGPAYVDFRGDKWLGVGTNPEDEHATIPHVQETTDDETAITAALATFPMINAEFDKLTALEPPIFGSIAEALGLGGMGDVHLGLRIYDDDK